MEHFLRRAYGTCGADGKRQTSTSNRLLARLTRRTAPRTSDSLRRHGWEVTDSDDLETSTDVLADRTYWHVTDICGGKSDIGTEFPASRSAAHCQHHWTQGRLPLSAPFHPRSTVLCQHHSTQGFCPLSAPFNSRSSVLSASFHSRSSVLCQHHSTQGRLSPVSTISPKVGCPPSAPFHPRSAVPCQHHSTQASQSFNSLYRILHKVATASVAKFHV